MSNSESLGHKIARLLEAEDSPFDLASVKVSLDAIYARLDKLESSRSNTMQLTHPSQERFAIAEAIADEVFGVNKEF